MATSWAADAKMQKRTLDFLFGKGDAVLRTEAAISAAQKLFQSDPNAPTPSTERLTKLLNGQYVTRQQFHQAVLILLGASTSPAPNDAKTEPVAPRFASWMAHWDAYKDVANQAVGTEAKANLHANANAVLSEFDGDGDGVITASEYDVMEGKMGEEWINMVNRMLEQRAKAQNTTREAMEDAYVQKHLTGITALGYTLTAEAKACLEGMLRRLLICDVGPAPFSVHAVEGLMGHMEEDACVSVTNHCLQVATHWLRNPIEMFEVLELEEFIALSIFHDIYYYDDFTHHDTRPVEDMKPFLRFTRPAEVIGGHLNHRPDAKALKSMKFSSEMEALKQEWVQMDWFLTMVSMRPKEDAVENNRPKDDVVLPLEFFYHIIGRVFDHSDSLVVEVYHGKDEH
jgi:hypothetical protein